MGGVETGNNKSIKVQWKFSKGFTVDTLNSEVIFFYLDYFPICLSFLPSLTFIIVGIPNWLISKFQERKEDGKGGERRGVRVSRGRERNRERKRVKDVKI